jgi:putative tricarboxylic transport membrane protein
MALISHVGFTASATALFVFVARGFGSERWLRDTVIGLVLAGAVYLFFTRALSVNLPAGKLFGG